METEQCVWCGLEGERKEGAVHRYLESSPACWAKYGELLAREYSDYRYMAVHGLTVDAYALQHPGRESSQTISSAYVHLASLYAHFEFGKPISELVSVRHKIAALKGQLSWLEPPDGMRDITVAHILEAQSPDRHCARVNDWAKYILKKWQPHHSTIQRLLGRN